jgi:hypothetical protein
MESAIHVHMCGQKGFRLSAAWSRLVLFLMFCALVLFLSPQTLLGKELPSDEVEVHTPVYFPSEDLELREGVFSYEVAWQGIPAAEAEVSVSREGAVYEVLVSAKTNSFVDVFYRLRYIAHGSLSAEDFSPGYLFIDQRENSRVTKATVSFTNDGRIRSELLKKKDSGNRITEYDFEADNFTLEPLSAAFLARSLDWEPGVSRSFDTFDAKSRYLVTLTCREKVMIEVNGVSRPVWIIEPEVQNLNKKEKASKLRKAYLYVTADKYRDVLQIKSEVFIGTVTTKLKSYSSDPPESVQLAQNM